LNASKIFEFLKKRENNMNFSVAAVLFYEIDIETCSGRTLLSGAGSIGMLRQAVSLLFCH